MLDVKLIRKQHKSYPEIFKAINKNFLPKAGTAVQETAVKLAPVDTSNLKTRINFKVKGDSVIIGTNVEYAPYVEYGTGIYAEGGGGRKTPWVYFHEKYGFVRTKGMVARPFLRPALDRNRKFLVALWADMYKKVFAILGAG
jgi:HK97 gp10 family phage protein